MNKRSAKPRVTLRVRSILPREWHLFPITLPPSGAVVSPTGWIKSHTHETTYVQLQYAARYETVNSCPSTVPILVQE